MTSEFGRPSEFEPAFQLGYLQSAVKYFLTGELRKKQLASRYADVLWFQRAAAVSDMVRSAAVAERAEASR